MTEAMHQILVVEDDAGIRDVLRVLLTAENYRVVEADDGAPRRDRSAVAQAGSAARRSRLARRRRPRRHPSACAHGRRCRSSCCRRARARQQKIAALDAGADDYVTKPFSAPELLARVRAALRRNVRGGERLATLRIGHTDVDLEQRCATSSAGDVHLTPLEYRMLECLVRHSGKIVRSEQLLREAWGPDKSGDTRTLRVCMKNLRDKLEPDPRRPQYLVTETGLGYRLRL